MRWRYVLLVFLFIIALSIILLLIGWNYTDEKPRGLFFNLATELLGAVLIFLFLNWLFPISEEKVVLERICATLERVEQKNSVFLDKNDVRKQFDFNNLLLNAKQLDVLGYSCVNLIENHRPEITNAVLNGTHVRILLVMPDSDAATLMHEHSQAHAFDYDMPKTQKRFKILENELVKASRKPKGSFKVKYTTWIPSCSLTIFNRKSDDGILKLKVYPILYSTPSSEITVHRVLNKKEHRIWFDYFANQFERLWNEYSYDSFEEWKKKVKQIT